jgi:hypothetical protein
MTLVYNSMHITNVSPIFHCHNVENHCPKNLCYSLFISNFQTSGSQRLYVGDTCFVDPKVSARDQKVGRDPPVENPCHSSVSVFLTKITSKMSFLFAHSSLYCFLVFFQSRELDVFATIWQSSFLFLIVRLIFIFK